MKKTSTLLLLLLSGIGFNTAFGQSPTPLYAGQYYSDQIDVVDTTGLSFTITGSMTATSDFGAVGGIFGMALHPMTDEMYICYQSGGAGARRLGTIDLETGSITDIGNAGNIVDMDFGPDGTLYGSTGNFSPDYSFVIIDIVTGANTFIFDYTPSSYGGGMAYDPFADRMYYQNNNGTAFIDLGTFIETVGSPTGEEGETQAMVILTPELGWAAFYGSLYSFNPVTEVYTYETSIASYHAFAFGQEPCLIPEIASSSTEECEGVEFTLSGTAPGTLSWDGGITDGVAFLPGTPGTYSYTVTSDDASVCPEGATIEISVVGLPTVSAGAGDLNFCIGEPVILSASGDADEYTWTDEAGGLDLTPAVGTHTYTVVGEYTEGGCIGGTTESSVEITVHELPTITASSSNDLFCIGDSTTVNGAGGESYVWSEVGIVDGVHFTPNSIGGYTYNVTGTDVNECSNTASVDIEVVEGITLSATTVLATEEDGEIDLTVFGGAPSFSYDWDNDGTGDFDDDEDLTGVPAGTYTVVVQSDAGCEMTGTFTVDSQLGITDLSSATVEVYPNPTTDIINVQLEGTFSYELVAINGEILVAGTATDKESLSLKGFADGIYFINVKSDNGSTTLKVVKK